ncbi:Hypothetical protein A7982_06058 [Minicystis rosea]|nr:Hypothetical protein A7982_06058 [Minicystis rosea]
MTTGWTDDFLDEMRRIGDPAADDLVRRLFAGNDVAAANRALRSFIRNDDDVPAELPDEVRAFLAKSAELPAWADPVRLARAAVFFEAHALLISVVLACYALPVCYAARKGVQVLHRTGLLRKDVMRRLLDTTQMVHDVMAEGGLGPGGCGVASAQKVRLRHAAVRHLLVTSPAGFSPELGAPINQEDLAGTLMSFSYVVLDGLAKLGVPASAEESDAYVHAWSVIGHLMGLRDELLPRDLAEAEALTRAIQRRQIAVSEEGRAFARALVEVMQEVVPGEAFDGLPASMMRHFMGDEIADLLGIPASDWTATVFTGGRWLSRTFGRLLDRSAIMTAFAQQLGRGYLGALAYGNHRGKRPAFAIPRALSAHRDPDSAPLSV